MKSLLQCALAEYIQDYKITASESAFLSSYVERGFLSVQSVKTEIDQVWFVYTINNDIQVTPHIKSNTIASSETYSSNILSSTFPVPSRPNTISSTPIRRKSKHIINTDPPYKRPYTAIQQTPKVTHTVSHQSASTKKPFKSPFTQTPHHTPNQSMSLIQRIGDLQDSIRIHKLVQTHIESGEYAKLSMLIEKWRKCSEEAKIYLQGIYGKDDSDSRTAFGKEKSVWDVLYQAQEDI